MSWVTFIWALVFGACATMALPHLLIGIRHRAWENLLFAISALAVAGIALGELAIMHSRTAGEIGRAIQWTHLPVSVLVIGIVGFVAVYFGTGRLWLGIAACGTRLLSLAINFAFPPNVNFREITGLRHIRFFGDTIATPEGVANHWTRLGELSSFLLLIFVIDASLTLWRRGGTEARRRAVFVGGSISLFIVLAAGIAALVNAQVVLLPYLISFPFVGVILAMGFELSYDILRAAQTARELRISEGALRESELRMSLAANAGNLGLWMWNVPHDVIWLSEKGRGLFGFAAAVPIDIGMFLESIHADDRERMRQLVQSSLERGGDYEDDYRITLPNGETRWICGYGRVEFDEQGKAAVMRGAVRDITQRKLAEESTRTSEELNRTVLASLHNQIAILDRTGTIVAVNDAWKKFALINGGAASATSPGVNYLDVCRCSASAGDGTAGRMLEGVQSVFEGAIEFFEIEYPCHSPSEPRWFLARVVPLKTPDGGVVVSHAEITQLKLAEEALRESEVRFRTVANVAPVMIWMSGPDKLCNFFNKGWLEFTGRTPAEEFGNGWAEGVHSEDLEHCIEVYGGAFDAREPFAMEYRLRRSDGEYRWVLDTGTPRFDAAGSFVGYIGSCLDIGDRKQAELDSQLQSMELARVGRVALMGELTASLAHEVNNPLGAMVTNASAGQRMLARGQLETEELRELLADIISDGHRAREVIEGIRNMVRKSEASRARISINEVIRDLLRVVRADATARQVTLVTEVDANAGIVMGDRVQLLQVLLNLTLNAFEALSVVRAEARRVIIRAERVTDGQICASVRDSGPGFPAGIVDQLFEPFFSTKTEGTGMGLAIARTIIETHGGTLSGKSCDDGGAIFSICLPEASTAQSEAA